jgi:hypothetical protein
MRSRTSNHKYYGLLLMGWSLAAGPK